MAANASDFAHFRQGELLPHLRPKSDTTGLAHFSRGELYPALLLAARTRAGRRVTPLMAPFQRHYFQGV